MRDLGLMGESTFSLWCADAGLIPNGSQIDKTGWDFFVEFPFESNLSPLEVHKPAFECKVQVKATDKNDRKLSITLSNLRRLITAQMPAFFVFIEFDKKETAQRAYVVHVDSELITNVLKRLHETEQSEKNNNLNKRTMTIHYDDTNLLKTANGNSLKTRFLYHIGADVSEYIANKKSHLESTGYENGFAQITFTTEGAENFKSLIDVSLGIKDEVEIAKIKNMDMRFGILSNNPSLGTDGGKMAMPDLKPTREGCIRFKEDRLSIGLSFECKLYISPFYRMIPKELNKYRVQGKFFDLIFNPLTGTSSFSFSFGEGKRLEVTEFRKVFKLLTLLTQSDKNIIAELIFDNSPKIVLKVQSKEQRFDFSRELQVLDSAVKIIANFEFSDFVDISLDEIFQYANQICQIEEILSPSPSLFKIEFVIDGYGYDPSNQTACILFVTTPVGSHVFGVILVIIGRTEDIQGNRYRLSTQNVVIEQRIVSEKNESICNDDLVAAIECVEKKYDDSFSVVTLFDKNIASTKKQTS